MWLVRRWSGDWPEMCYMMALKMFKAVERPCKDCDCRDETMFDFDGTTFHNTKFVRNTHEIIDSEWRKQLVPVAISTQIEKDTLINSMQYFKIWPYGYRVTRAVRIGNVELQRMDKVLCNYALLDIGAMISIPVPCILMFLQACEDVWSHGLLDAVERRRRA
ncbi:unnamed protein product [Prorocentrum cordatum]|uniref:Uncharacterized protein n=1 Tax=Prorocentrum cordatum TaxID=2364126 RepID=A0ABN9PZY2_9DINO|nr:unnamed protein product [Polarella glacialis]